MTPTRELLISVIIPVYEVESFLRECVDSVLSQSYPHLEVILVDDGSPDLSPQICEEYASQDQRVKVLHKENGGLSDARNYGLREASGEYVVFLDSDDYWSDLGAVASAVEILRNTPSIDLLYFDCLYLSQGKIKEREPIEITQINNRTKVEALEYMIGIDRFIVTAWSKFVRRKLLVDNSITFKKGLLSEDYDWNFWVVIHSRVLHAMDKNFYVYRLRQGSITSQLSSKHLWDIWSIIIEWNTRIDELVKDDRESESYHNFIAYIYGMLMSVLYTSDNKSSRQELMRAMKQYKHIIKYAASPKTKTVKVMCQLLGFNITCRVLGGLRYLRSVI